MRSSRLSLDKYDSDKVTNRYLERYDPLFQPWVDKPVVLLELGIHKGGSLLLWRDYFPAGTIVGVDLRVPPDFQPTDRVRLFQGNQTDSEFLSRVAAETAPNGFDIIIDDASHIGVLTKIAFWHLFENHLKANGLYVIEDWGTGYWSDWPDGKTLDLSSYELSAWRRSRAWLYLSKRARRWGLKAPMRNHSYGMVGFVKQLIDEQASHDVTRRLLSGQPGRASRFESVTVAPSLVFVRKAAAGA